MTTALIVILMCLDVVLFAAIFYLGRKKIDNRHLIVELTEERRYLTELRNSIQEDLENARSHSQELLKRMTHIAAEAEQEVKGGGDTLAKEMDEVAKRLANQFEEPLKELSRRQSSFEGLLRRSDQEKSLLLKALDRAEKLSRFFDQKIPYEDVLQEIQDKKYNDARQLLAQGVQPDKVAKELGLNLGEVHLLVGLY